MRKISLMIFGLSLFAFSHGEGKGEVVLKKPPESLKKYYPPHSEKFEFLSNMHTMSTAFYAVQLNINDENWEKAVEWAKKLVETYKKTSEMVPEWKDYFDFKKADNYLKAVESRNVDRVIKASRELGKTCAKCHQDNEIAVKIYYHFPNFEEVKVEDPIEFTEMKLGDFMKKLTNSLKVTNIYLSQGNITSAQEHGINFVERARALKETCSKCHTKEAEIEVITGKDYDKALSALENLFNAEKPNPNEIKKNLSKVTVTCYTCHNVHLIPAKIKSALGK
ncbi:hypothetical protein JCM9492_09100 [Aquifex pyrophilus]